jgi:hypothetical protein
MADLTADKRMNQRDTLAVLPGLPMEGYRG